MSELGRKGRSAPVPFDTAGGPIAREKTTTPAFFRSPLARSAVHPFTAKNTPRDVCDSREPGSPPARPPEAASWGRYEGLELIAAGGMGEIYKARDPRLNRLVALKLIRGNDPALVQQFFWEAQAQARIDHPHVCKIYEVGDVDNVPYIAMQYIHGEPLCSAAQKMALEQRVKVIQSIAEGLHAAHKLGLIHRDIKPSNILVERTPEGAFCAYLVDFGLAREIAPNGRALFAMEGTPLYMSPEQAAGNSSSLDRRTDIYSLGATTYELLAGRPPFDGEEVLQVIREIVHTQPRPVRELDKAIPADLEAIVMKCLEKEPQQRYESARALAEDLGRYLDGEPTLARQVSRFHWAWKKAQKHKLLVAISACALLVLIVSGVATWRAKAAAARQAQRTEQVGIIAQSFGQDVKEMEFFMRYAYALPLHDTTREKEIIRVRMAKIERQMETTRASFGDLVEGPGHYALGQGYLVLREPERALTHLERALKSGNAAPEAALAAGQTHGMLYRRSMDALQRIADKQVREAQQNELEEQHLKPALRYLRQSAAAEVEPSPYTTALIALYENRFDDALQASSLAFEQSSWLYEAKKTEAEVYFTRGTTHHEKGSHEAALSDYKRAIESYQAAAAIARSDPTVYEAEAEVWIQLLVIVGPTGSDLEKPFLKAVASSDNAILAEPRQGRFYAKKAWAHLYYGMHLLSSGADPRPTLRDGIDAGQQAIQWDGPDANAYNSIGTSYSFLAFYERSLSLDPRPSLRSAIENTEHALALNPNSSWAWNDLGAAYTTLGEFNASRGSDPLPFFQLGATSIDHAIDLSPHDHAPYVNLGWLYAQKAQYEIDHGQNPEESLDGAIGSLEIALGMRQDSYQCYNNLGLAYSIRGRYERSIGRSAEVSLLRAHESYSMAIRTHPEDVEARQGAAVVLGQMALSEMDRHDEPQNSLREGRRTLQDIATNHPNAQAQLALGQLELLAARWAIHQNTSPEKTFQSAKRALDRAIASNHGSSVAFQTLAEMYRWRGERALSLGLRAGDDIRTGLATIEKALAVNPTMPSSFAIQGALYLLEARAEHEPSAKKRAARSAKTALEKALAANPFLQREYAPLALEATRLLDVS